MRRQSGLVLLSVIILLLAGCSSLSGARPRVSPRDLPTPTPIPTPIVPVKPTYQVQRGEVSNQLRFTGRVEPVRQQELFFRVSGRVRKIYVEGQAVVKAGQVLADLENDDLARQLAAAQLEVDRAKLRLQGAQADLQEAIKRAQVNLDIAQLSLQAVKQQDPTPRKTQAQVALEKAKGAVDQAQAAYDAISWRNDKAASQEAAVLHQATLDYTQAKANYDLAMQDIAGHQVQLSIQEKQVELAQLALDALNRGVDPLMQNDVDRAQLETQKLQVAVSETQVIAPFDGQVTSLLLSAGRAADAFKPVITVADPISLEISADLISTQMQLLQEGMPVSVTLTGRPGETLKGSIRYLPYPYGQGGVPSTTQEGEPDQSVRVALEADPAGKGYEMGDLAQVTVQLERRENVLWLPPQAIRTFEGRKFVVVQENGAQRRIDIKLGLEGEDRVEIADGLSEGQTILGQ